jgi:hypothetical protein
VIRDSFAQLSFSGVSLAWQVPWFLGVDECDDDVTHQLPA